MSKKRETRLIILLMIIGLLVSISYLALEISIYIEGRWQLVQSQGLRLTVNNGESYEVQVPELVSYQDDYWDVIRAGELFFKPLPEQPVVQQPIIIPQTPKIETPIVVEKPKPTCPLMNMGVMIGSPSLAILANKQTQKSEIVKVGMLIGEYEVIEITVDYVLVKNSEAEFKLEVGGI